MVVYLAIDVGGTFTDLVGVESESGLIITSKVPTTPDRPSLAMFECIKKAGINIGETAAIIHGSTIAINTVIEGKGSKTALFTTKGFRDVYLIGRANRRNVFDIYFRKPRPLINRRMIFEVDERTLPNGHLLKPVKIDEVRALIEARLKNQPVEAVAVCFLHSYVNPANESVVYELLRKSLPNCYVTASYKIIRKYGEYERLSSTIINAYIGPTVSRYIVDVEKTLREAGFKGHLLIMESNGGTASPSSAVEKPIALLESGPVGGIIASAYIGSRLGFNNIITLDIGGTTAKTSVIFNGRPQIVDGYYIGDRYIMLPVVDIVEVGAGGGSIAWIDSLGNLKVGPISAGASPGPVCYGKGGVCPTVTDANLILGRLGRKDFLGGEMLLDYPKCYEVMKERIASPLGLSVEEASESIIRIAVSTTSLAVRRATIERGYDPRDFILFAYGGAGPLHAMSIARELYIPKVLIPLYPAHFSALGMILTDYRKDLVRTYYRFLEDLDMGELFKVVEEMKREAEEKIREETDVSNDIIHDIILEMRYVGQEFTIEVPVSAVDLRKGNPKILLRRFNEIYAQLYGFSFAEEKTEIVNIHLITLAKRKKPIIGFYGQKAYVEPIENRRVLIDGEWVDCPVYQREMLPPSFRVEGPAIIKEYASTTILMEGDRCEVANSGELLITVGEKNEQ